MATGPKKGAERQQTYRQRKNLRFLEVTEETYGRIRNIGKQQNWTLEQAVAEAMTLLEIEIKANSHSKALAEMHKRAAAEKAKQGIPLTAKPPPRARKPKAAAEPEPIDGQGNLL